MRRNSVWPVLICIALVGCGEKSTKPNARGDRSDGDARSSERLENVLGEKVVKPMVESMLNSVEQSNPGFMQQIAAVRKVTPLHLAASENKTAEAKKLLAAGADVNARDVQGLTPLHYAAAGTGADIIPVLLEAGADIRAKDKDGRTPLHLAMVFGGGGGEKALPHLLKAKADLDAPDSEGRTPLLCALAASSFPDADRIGLLIAAGADVNRSPPVGFGPLHWACRQNAELVKMLIAAGANINAKDEEGATPLIVASRLGVPNIITALLEAKADPNLRDRHGWSPLAHAADRGSVNVAAALREAGASEPSWTRLHVAAIFEKPEKLSLLLGDKADLNARDVYGRTPLFWAIRCNEDEAADQLVAAGADLTVVDKRHSTVLLTAAWAGNVSVMQKAISAGADVNAADDDGYTPLLWMSSYGDADTIRFLLEKGAKIDVVTKAGDTPLLLAMDAREREEAIKTLLANGGNVLAVNRAGKSIEGELWRIQDNALQNALKDAVADARQKQIDRICFLYSADNPNALKADAVEPTTPERAALRMYRAMFGPDKETFVSNFVGGEREMAAVDSLYDFVQEYVAFQKELAKAFGPEGCRKFDQLKSDEVIWSIGPTMVEERSFDRMKVELQGDRAVCKAFPGFDRAGDFRFVRQGDAWRIEASVFLPAERPDSLLEVFRHWKLCLKTGRDAIRRPGVRLEDVKKAMWEVYKRG